MHVWAAFPLFRALVLARRNFSHLESWILPPLVFLFSLDPFKKKEKGGGGSCRRQGKSAAPLARRGAVVGLIRGLAPSFGHDEVERARGGRGLRIPQLPAPPPPAAPLEPARAKWPPPRAGHLARARSSEMASPSGRPFGSSPLEPIGSSTTAPLFFSVLMQAKRHFSS